MLIFKISVFLNIVAFVFLDDKLILTPPPIIIMNFLCIDIKVFVISIITSLCDKPKILTNTEYFFPWKIDKSLETVNLTTAIIITRSSIYNTIDKEHLVGYWLPSRLSSCPIPSTIIIFFLRQECGG